MVNARRMWVNQPSTLQTYHKYHGTNVLVISSPDDLFLDYCRVYFLKGEVISMQMCLKALSKGWK